MNQLLQGTIYLEEELTETVRRLRSLADDLEGVCQGVAPAVPGVTVDEWFWGQKALPCLVGKITGHPTLRGPYSATSQLFFLNQNAGLARTYTRWYRLGRPVINDHSLQ